MTTYYHKNANPYTGPVELIDSIPYRIFPGGKERLYTQTELNTQLVRNRITVKGGSKAPQSTLPTPQIRDYEFGKIFRYIVQKRTDPYNTIIEISENQKTYYTPQNKRGIDPRIYNLVEVPWMITGEIEFVTYTNLRTVQVLETVFPGLSYYLRDPLQFYREKI